ncbi:MAG TPA: hypothetical protein VK855_05770 [Thioalkalivibrio sp.]|nr:hypothetical protein [Thioalkalivibrio sp.]
MPSSVLTRGLVALALFVCASLVQAETLKPFVLAYSKAGTDLSAEFETVREKLQGAGFRILGEYPVTDGARVLVATSDSLLAAAASAPRAGYIAPLRVAVTRVGNNLQVSYLNLEYFRHAYQLDTSLAGAADQLAARLGASGTYGAEGLTPSTLERYRYAFGMERFGDPYLLANHPDRRAALAALDANLWAGKGGVREVYRVDIPGQDTTVIGVSIREDSGADRDASDAFKLATVDVGDPRHTAYFPYEILVRGGQVEALHMRFRMALHFPDMSMVGDNSFMQLRRSPAAVEQALKQAAGG